MRSSIGPAVSAPASPSAGRELLDTFTAADRIEGCRTFHGWRFANRPV